MPRGRSGNRPNVVIMEDNGVWLAKSVFQVDSEASLYVLLIK